MTLPQPQIKPTGWIVAAAAAAAAIFTLDLFTPLGYAVPMLYVLPILLMRFVRSRRSSVLSAAIALVLTWVGTLFSPGEATAQIIGNRAMASVLLLVVAMLLIKQKQLSQQHNADRAALRESEAHIRTDLQAMIHLHKLGMMSVQDKSLPAVLLEIVDAAIAVSRSDFGNIQLLDPDSGDLRIVAQRGFPQGWVEFWDCVSKGQGVCGTALDRGERVIVEDVEQSPIFTGTRALEIQRQTGVRAVQSTPLVNRSGQTLGIFSTHYRTSHRPDERTLRLLDMLARQAADLIDSARAEAALRALNANLEKRVKERSAELVQANERWDWVVRATHDGVWDWNLLNDTVYLSPRWKELHGFLDSDPLESAQEWSDRIHPDDRERMLGKLQDHLSGKHHEFWEEYRIRRKDGRFIWVLDRGVALWDEQGRAYRMVGAETDITWRKEAEEAVRRSEHEFHTLANNVPAFFSYIDRDRRYRFVNKRYEELFGRPLDTIVGMPMHDLLGPDGYAQIQPYLDKALAGEEISFDYELKVPGAGVRYFTAQHVPDWDLQGQVVGLFALLADVTTLKASEATLREREAQLRDLSVKLIRVQEQERRRIARELHDDLTQRLAALTIELRSLHRQIPEADGFLVSRLQQMGTSAEQLTTDLEQIAHHLHPSILEHVGLEAAVREHVHEFSTRTGIMTEILTRGVPKGIPLAHATCLYRVLQESLRNVKNHAHATNVLVRVLKTDGGLGLCVHDDGVGFQNSSGLSGSKGLGLTSLSERVAALKGTFRIRTKPGDGTEVHAWVPLSGETPEE